MGEIKPGAALDALVAEYVKGWPRCGWQHQSGYWFAVPKSLRFPTGVMQPEEIPPWSTDDGEAIRLLVEHNAKKATLPLSLICRHNSSSCDFGQEVWACMPPWNWQWLRTWGWAKFQLLSADYHWHETPALAIVVGILLASGVTLQEIEEACK